MMLDAVMWAGLFLVGLALIGYLLAVLLNPEKW
ncbi:potassium-transporting ATPase subunit F [Paenarthrobacter ilicis]|uniref:K+-transporting ATPase KdpF subunit n=1 Tax=Paenarthrobacter ilicis TaxID=43665 RepID=A0ABX0THQ0_9MICC|nr:potassium-transporting ATPase subunit F [Paenarthrobacter ilicis]MBM7791746.1 K+-transporting ATPase KdpF subunit [Paenarthrobacter ilicis]NIJ01629.1 K+-transporting ATPase KdpF subunit [Paenarthrobacter ilicis]